MSNRPDLEQPQQQQSAPARAANSARGKSSDEAVGAVTLKLPLQSGALANAGVMASTPRSARSTVSRVSENRSKASSRRALDSSPPVPPAIPGSAEGSVYSQRLH